MLTPVAITQRSAALRITAPNGKAGLPRPCAIAWAGLGGVVWGTSIEKLRQFGIRQISIPATAVIAAAPFYPGSILGPVLDAETDALFRDPRRS